MKKLQIFETTVFSDSIDYTVHAVIVPGRSFAANDGVVNADSIVSALDFRKLSPSPISASSLISAFAVLLSPAIPEAMRIADLTAILQGPTIPTPANVSLADRHFSEWVVLDNLMPFEQSPIDLQSLGKLVVSASGAGLGAYAGFILAGTTPLLLITVPAGMILCGAAKGIADALEKGLREKLLRFLTGKK